MNIPRIAFERAARQVPLTEVQVEKFWRRLQVLPTAGRVEIPERFEVTTVAYYFDALIIMGAMGWFMTTSWEAFGSLGIFLIAAAYALVFATVGKLLWRWPAGGLLVTVAVAMTSLTLYELQRWTGCWTLRTRNWCLAATPRLSPPPWPRRTWPGENPRSCGSVRFAGRATRSLREKMAQLSTPIPTPQVSFTPDATAEQAAYTAIQPRWSASCGEHLPRQGDLKRGTFGRRFVRREHIFSTREGSWRIEPRTADPRDAHRRLGANASTSSSRYREGQPAAEVSTGCRGRRMFLEASYLSRGEQTHSLRLGVCLCRLVPARPRQSRHKRRERRRWLPADFIPFCA